MICIAYLLETTSQIWDRNRFAFSYSKGKINLENWQFNFTFYSKWKSTSIWCNFEALCWKTSSLKNLEQEYAKLFVNSILGIRICFLYQLCFVKTIIWFCLWMFVFALLIWFNDKLSFVYWNQTFMYNGIT